MRVLLLSIGDDEWAVRLEQVHEVMAAPALTAIPSAPRALLGVCNRRGDVLPVVSLPAVLGFAAPSTSERAASWVVVVATPEGLAGIVVTRVPEACELGDRVAPGEAVGAASVHRLDGDGELRAVTLLDLDIALTPARIAGPS